MTRTTILFLGLALTAGCGSSSTTDAGTDTGPTTDAGTHDAATGTDVQTGADVQTATDVQTGTDVQTATDSPALPTGTLTGTAVDATMTPVMGLAGVVIKTCAASDTMCASPFAMTTTTGATGAFTITYPLTGGMFTGYLQFTGGTTEMITPTRTFIALGATSTASFPLVASATFGAASLLSSTIVFDSSHGAVTYNVLTAGADGGTNAVAGASVSVSPSPTGIVPFFVMSGSPFPSLTATSTDSSGEGGFFTVAPGTYTFTATGGDAGTLGTITASVIGGFITAFSL